MPVPSIVLIVMLMQPIASVSTDVLADHMDTNTIVMIQLMTGPHHPSKGYTVWTMLAMMTKLHRVTVMLLSGVQQRTALTSHPKHHLLGLQRRKTLNYVN